MGAWSTALVTHVFALVALGVPLFGFGLRADVLRISEFMAANTQAHPDVVDFEDYPDWIELHHGGDQALGLGGYFLSDDPSRPLKWAFPAATEIAAGGRLVVWADGYDAVPGDVRPRGYWPWRNFTVSGHHTNFGLSSDGEAVVLSRVARIDEEPLVSAGSGVEGGGSLWRYLANGQAPDPRWKERGFNDGGWPVGAAKLGYGDSGVVSVVPFGPSSSNKWVTTYFRHRFTVADPAAVAGLRMGMVIDDGAVVYLNGRELVRQNMPAGPIGHLTFASSVISGSAETRFTEYRLGGSDLVAGENVLAVEVHQVNAGSSDLGFDLWLTAERAQGLEILDEVGFGPQVADVSMARSAADSRVWEAQAVPTPGSANAGSVVDDLRSAGVGVEILPIGGMSEGPVVVTMLAAGPGEVRYTLDGSLPRIDSPGYEGPLALASTTVVRARVFAAGRPPGAVATRTYLMGEPARSLPVISVVADPEALFGDEIGICYNQREPLVSSSSNAALGLRDVYKGKDAPGSLEWFEPGGGGFRVGGGLRIGGENNWVHGQRALNFALRGRYGDDAIKYDLFPGSRSGVHGSITLRDGGDAWAKEMLRDGLWPFLAGDQLEVDTSDYRAGVVYINGRYWGIHNVRSRWDKTWFAERKRADPDKVDHLQYGHVYSSSVRLGVERGDSDDWLALLEFLATADLADPVQWAYLESRMEVDSFIDFVVCESWGLNTSWRHNREFWREKRPGGRWRWFLPDMDQTFRTSQLSASVLADMLTRDEVLVRVKNSPFFRERLVQRWAAHLASTFAVERVVGLLDRMAAEVEDEVPRHVARWAPFNGMSLLSRASELQGIKTFTASRAANMHGELRSRFGLGEPVVLALGMSGSGRVRVAGVMVDAGELLLFPGIPFSLEAEAAPGYEFDGWVGLEGGAVTEHRLEVGGVVEAIFVPSGERVMGGEIDGDLLLDAAGSPYVVAEDLVVPAGRVLTISAGVELRMESRVNLRVLGELRVEGSGAAHVWIGGRNGVRWGGISVEGQGATAELRYLVIRGATRGHDPVKHPSAVSGYHADLLLEHVDIDGCEGPVFARGGSTILRFCRLHTPYTGDCINVKEGYAEVEDSVFMGNLEPDTDAIDYDGVVGGAIRRNRIYRFLGSNSDAIDLGEGCKDLVIEDNLIYHISDKAFSVGQASEVLIRRNVVHDCGIGVAVKDSGSVARVERNTFHRCGTGVGAYEKNFGKGGGVAWVENSVFAGGSGPVFEVDQQSVLGVRYSLADSVLPPGESNLRGDPRFVDVAVMDFGLRADSPARDAGDPLHPFDPDGTRVDMGAAYVYSANHYPFRYEQTVVIEEVMANPGGGGSDWIELRNRTTVPVDIGGWFLSDRAGDLRKYRIAEGTVLPAGGHLVFFSAIHFGADSVDPGKVTPFGISATGETVYLSSATGDELSGYLAKEDFGASLAGVSLGNHYKAGSGTWNFVPLERPTPGAPNSPPRVGPVVISEIMAHPPGHADSEYLELLNVGDEVVELFDAARGAGWKMTDGIDYEFGADSAVALAPGERLVLTRSLARFHAAWQVPDGTRVLQWSSGRLSNEGERVQLGRPAGLDDDGVRKHARVDRVTYGVESPWPPGVSGGGMALVRVRENEYGNDAANWMAGEPRPGARSSGAGYDEWQWGGGLSGGFGGDDDGDGLPNGVEYALGSDGGIAGSGPGFRVMDTADGYRIDYEVRADRSGVLLDLEWSGDLSS